MIRKYVLLLLLILIFAVTDAQKRSRLPESGVEAGFAITPLRFSSFTPTSFQSVNSRSFLFDPIPEIFIKFPIKGLRIRSAYDYNREPANYVLSDWSNQQLDGTFYQHSLSAGVEKGFRIRRNRFYVLSDLRYTTSRFSGTRYYEAGPGLPATTLETDIILSGLGFDAGIGWRYPLYDKLELFAETSLAVDRLIMFKNDIFLDGTNIIPKLFTVGLIYRFEKAYDCNCPTNTIRRK